MGLEGRTIRTVVFDEHNKDIIYVGAENTTAGHGRDGGIFKTINGGANWDTLLTEFSIHEIALHPHKPDTIYVTSGSVRKTIDGGKSWFAVSSGIFGYVMPLAMDILHPDTLYTGTVGMDTGGDFYKTTNGGQTWNSMYYWNNILSIAVDPVNTSIIYFGTDWTCDILKSSDGGLTWAFSLEHAESGIFGIEIDPHNHEVIYAAAGVIYKSVDAGSTWVKSNEGLPDNGIISSIAINPVDSQEIYGCGLSGVFKSTNAGSTWTAMNHQGLDDRCVTTLAIDPTGSLILAGTGNGVYSYPITTSVDDLRETVLKTMLLYQNYPNPFNLITTIKYRISSRSRVNLTIFNISGEEVINLVDKEQQAGSYGEIWNGKNREGKEVSSGIYLYNLRVNSFAESKKMIIIR